MNTRLLHRRLIGFGTSVFVVAVFSASAGAETTAPSRADAAQPTAAFADVKPIIGRPTASPARLVAGGRVVITFRVTRSDTGRPLPRGSASASVRLDGRPTASTASFRAGLARVSVPLPTLAGGKTLTVTVTVRAGRRTATRTARFAVAAAPLPSISVGDVTAAEGNGPATMTFRVTLSKSSPQTVSVSYRTTDGTATAPSDYTAATGTVTFAPGQTSQEIRVPIVGDNAVEGSESFTLTLFDPSGASIAAGTATGTITNDDTAPPVVPGTYRGATQDGNFVFLTVTPDRNVTGFRVNDLPETCNGPFLLRGGINWSENTFPIRSDGSFSAQGQWTGSVVSGDLEFTGWSARLVGTFTGTSVSGTVATADDVRYRGAPYHCATGDVRWSATLQ